MSCSSPFGSGHFCSLLPAALHGKDKAEELGRARTAVLGVLAGGIAVVGAIYTHRSYVLNRAVHDATASLAREGQITERFTRAIDQLGGHALAVRLGGIYALERIARESPVDHWSIMEILTAWIREQSNEPLRGEVSSHRPELEDSAPGEESAGIAADVQAALRVLGRRRVDHDREGYHLNLENACLVAADLAGAELATADLSGADLSRADLSESNLQDALLTHARLTGALLKNTNLSNAALGGTDLRDARIWGADLSDASLTGANLTGVDLDWADFQGATIDGRTIADVDLVAMGAERVGGVASEGGRVYVVERDPGAAGPLPLRAASGDNLEKPQADAEKGSDVRPSEA